MDQEHTFIIFLSSRTDFLGRELFNRSVLYSWIGNDLPIHVDFVIKCSRLRGFCMRSYIHTTKLTQLTAKHNDDGVRTEILHCSSRTSGNSLSSKAATIMYWAKRKSRVLDKNSSCLKPTCHFHRVIYLFYQIIVGYWWTTICVLFIMIAFNITSPSPGNFLLKFHLEVNWADQI